jgi:hypothetical protein
MSSSCWPLLTTVTRPAIKKFRFGTLRSLTARRYSFPTVCKLRCSLDMELTSTPSVSQVYFLQSWTIKGQRSLCFFNRHCLPSPAANNLSPLTYLPLHRNMFSRILLLALAISTVSAAPKVARANCAPVVRPHGGIIPRRTSDISQEALSTSTYAINTENVQTKFTPPSQTRLSQSRRAALGYLVP